MPSSLPSIQSRGIFEYNVATILDQVRFDLYHSRWVLNFENQMCDNISILLSWNSCSMFEVKFLLTCNIISRKFVRSTLRGSLVIVFIENCLLLFRFFSYFFFVFLSVAYIDILLSVRLVDYIIHLRT